MRVLIVDEDPQLVEELPPILRREGHNVYLGKVGNAAEIALTEGVDLVILDPVLYPFNLSLDLCYTIKRERATMFLFVSRLCSVGERVRALETVANVCLVKPVALEELLAQIHALLRCHPASAESPGFGLVQVTRDLILDMPGRRLISDKEEVPLSAREFWLLAHLIRHEGQALSRQLLLRAVWGSGYEGATREVDVYMRYLRQKIEPEPSRPRYLLSVWGVGYRYERPLSAGHESVGSFHHPSRKKIPANY